MRCAAQKEKRRAVCTALICEIYDRCFSLRLLVKTGERLAQRRTLYAWGIPLRTYLLLFLNPCQPNGFFDPIFGEQLATLCITFIISFLKPYKSF